MFVWVNKIYYIENKGQMFRRTTKIALNIDNIFYIIDKFSYAWSEYPLTVVVEDKQEIKCVDCFEDVMSQLGSRKNDFAEFFVDADGTKVPILINKRAVISVRGDLVDTKCTEISTSGGGSFTVEEVVDSVIEKLGDITEILVVANGKQQFNINEKNEDK